MAHIDTNPAYQPPPAPLFKHTTTKPQVCYPSLNELEKNLPPPGMTPVGSSSNLFSSMNQLGSRPTTPNTLLSTVHSHTDTSSVAINTSSSSRDDVPLMKPVLVMPRSATMRKKTLLIKDTNSNLLEIEEVENIPPAKIELPETTAPTENAPAELDIWKSIGKSCTPLTARTSRRKPRYASSLVPKRQYVMTGPEIETKPVIAKSASVKSLASVASSTDTIESSLDPRDLNNNRFLQRQTSESLDQYPPKYKYMFKGGRSRSSPNSSTSGPQRNTYPHLKSVIKELKEREVVFDRFSAIQALRQRVLRGEKVTHEEINAIRNMTLPPHQRHLGWRLPWSKDLACIKGLVHIPTPNKPPPERNTFGTVEDLRLPTEGITAEHWGRRHYVLNLAGFHDDDISLYLEGRNRLVIRAVRPDGRNENLPGTTVTETIVLPPDLPADNLRIVRKPSGTTVIEESWRF